MLHGEILGVNHALCLLRLQYRVEVYNTGMAAYPLSANIQPGAVKPMHPLAPPHALRASSLRTCTRINPTYTSPQSHPTHPPTDRQTAIQLKRLFIPFHPVAGRAWPRPPCVPAPAPTPISRVALARACWSIHTTCIVLSNPKSRSSEIPSHRDISHCPYLPYLPARRQAQTRGHARTDGAALSANGEKNATALQFPISRICPAPARRRQAQLCGHARTAHYY
ncbi:hypothetical protein DFH11DRAFT_729047 [Phellopilus nigrolimitatus]|nr:hypothetical protein DFH11DRAFT_729047 [Phellopilus nigrolimitatus]